MNTTILKISLPGNVNTRIGNPARLHLRTRLTKHKVHLIGVSRNITVFYLRKLNVRTVIAPIKHTDLTIFIHGLCRTRNRPGSHNIVLIILNTKLTIRKRIHKILLHYLIHLIILLGVLQRYRRYVLSLRHIINYNLRIFTSAYKRFVGIKLYTTIPGTITPKHELSPLGSAHNRTKTIQVRRLRGILSRKIRNRAPLQIILFRRLQRRNTKISIRSCSLQHIIPKHIIIANNQRYHRGLIGGNIYRIILHSRRNGADTSEGHVTYAAEGNHSLEDQRSRQTGVLIRTSGKLRRHKQRRVPLSTYIRTILHNITSSNIFQHFLRRSCRNTSIYRLTNYKRTELRHLGRGIITHRLKIESLLLTNAVSVPRNGKKRAASFSTGRRGGYSINNNSNPSFSKLTLIKARRKSVKRRLSFQYLIQVKRLTTDKIPYTQPKCSRHRKSNRDSLILLRSLRNKTYRH